MSKNNLETERERKNRKSKIIAREKMIKKKREKKTEKK